MGPWTPDYHILENVLGRYVCHTSTRTLFMKPGICQGFLWSDHRLVSRLIWPLLFIDVSKLRLVSDFGLTLGGAHYSRVQRGTPQFRARCACRD